jgi:hypothetical protein
MKCPNCDHEGSVAEFGDPLRCPDCGAYYEKALALKLRKQSLEQGQVPSGQEKLTVGKLAGKADNALRAAADVVTPKPYPNGARGKYYCPSCGQTGNGVRHVPGSILIELVLWLCFLIPGLIYSIWRHAASKKACHKCREPGLIPVDSPRARRELGAE